MKLVGEHAIDAYSVMKIGLIGLNQTGKTSLFELVTGRRDDTPIVGGKEKVNIGTGIVPDKRVEYLSEMFKPKKTTFAKIDFTDVTGLTVSDGQKGSKASKFLADVRDCDAIVHVLRAFESDAVFHDLDTIDPLRDLELVEGEMLLADLELIEKRIERIKAGKKVSAEQQKEIDLLTRCFSRLEEVGTIKDIDMSEQEQMIVKAYALFTDKPRIAVLNVDDTQLDIRSDLTFDNLRQACQRLNFPLVSLCVSIELEISRLDAEDSKVFMDELGITQPGIELLTRSVYERLNLISFFTYGADEVKAWTIDKGTPAKKAAGKIHSDIERGFIRAEVVKYDELYELGSMAKVKEKGLFRLEGKEYTVLDGDIITFRFNV